MQFSWVAKQSVHSPPFCPQSVSDVPVRQRFPSQQPLQFPPAMQRHCWPEQSRFDWLQLVHA
jgi:hypothetical protein